MGINYSYSDTLFQEEDKNFLSTRHDTTNVTGISLNALFFYSYKLNIAYNFTDVYSNQAPYVMRKEVTTIGISRNF
jgi:hypothetical protein